MVGGEVLDYYAAWWRGERIAGGVPLGTAPDVAHRFYYLERQDDGRYSTYNPLTNGDGTIEDPWRPTSGNARALTEIEMSSAVVLSSGSTTAIVFNAASGDLVIDITDAFIADTRSAQAQNDVPVTLTARGIERALETYSSVTLSILYAEDFRAAPTINIVGAAR